MYEILVSQSYRGVKLVFDHRADPATHVVLSPRCQCLTARESDQHGRARLRVRGIERHLPHWVRPNGMLTRNDWVAAKNLLPIDVPLRFAVVEKNALAGYGENRFIGPPAPTRCKAPTWMPPVMDAVDQVRSQRSQTDSRSVLIVCRAKQHRLHTRTRSEPCANRAGRTNAFVDPWFFCFVPMFLFIPFAPRA
jgi:hypothetical protein